MSEKRCDQIENSSVVSIWFSFSAVNLVDFSSPMRLFTIFSISNWLNIDSNLLLSLFYLCLDFRIVFIFHLITVTFRYIFSIHWNCSFGFNVRHCGRSSTHCFPTQSKALHVWRYLWDQIQYNLLSLTSIFMKIRKRNESRRFNTRAQSAFVQCLFRLSP